MSILLYFPFYDRKTFSPENTLILIGRRRSILINADRQDEAIATLEELNTLETEPAYIADNYAMLGSIFEERGDIARALES